jgi:hypothetical protein
MAISSDGQFVYTLLPSATSGSIARFNMLTQQLDFTSSGFQATGYNTALRDLATLPGSPNTVAVDEGEYPGTSLFDFDPVNQVATRRGSATGIYTGPCSSCWTYKPGAARFRVNRRNATTEAGERGQFTKSKRIFILS